MKTVNCKAVTESAYGKRIPAIKYQFDYIAYEGIVEVREANDLLTDEEIVDARNRDRKNNARQKALQAAWDMAGIPKPDLKTDYDLRVRKMSEIFVAAGYSEEESVAKAVAALA